MTVATDDESIDGNNRIGDSLMRSWDMCVERVKGATPVEWNRMRPMSGGTTRCAFRCDGQPKPPWDQFVEHLAVDGLSAPGSEA